MELRRDSLFGIIDQICFDQFVESQLLRLSDVRDVATALFRGSAASAAHPESIHIAGD